MLQPSGELLEACARDPAGDVAYCNASAIFGLAYNAELTSGDDID